MKNKIIILSIAICLLIITFLFLSLRSSETIDIANNNVDLPSDIIAENINNNRSPNVESNDAEQLGFTVTNNQLAINNNSGQQILARDFRRDSDVEQNPSVDESYALQPETNTFSVFFTGFSGQFQATILDANYTQALFDLERYLLQTLDVSPAELCFLDIAITAPYWTGIPEGTLLILPSC